jgi:hypothetical protein
MEEALTDALERTLEEHLLLPHLIRTRLVLA